MLALNTAAGTHAVFQFQATITAASVATIVAAEQAFTITPGAATNTLRSGIGGLKSTDQISVTGPGTGNASALVGARINATGQVVLVFVNPTAGSLTPAAGVYQFTIVRLA